MADTIIDALVVTLGLDSSGFNKGRKEVGEGLDETRDNADRTAKDMEAAGKRAASFFGSIKTELLALVGVSLSVNGIKNFVKDMTGGLQTLAVNSKALDMSARSLDGWQRAAEMAGSSAEEITGKLQALQNLITDFRGGGNVSDNPINKALQGFAAAVGGDIDLQNMSSGDIMKFVAENFHKLSKDAQRKFANDMGYSNALLMTLSEGTLLPNQRSAEANSGITDESLRKAQDMQKSIVDMEQSFKSAAITLYSTLVPYIDKYLIPALIKISDWITEHGPQIEKFFSDSADEISKAVDAVGGWQNALSVLAAFIAGSWALKIISAVARVGKSFAPLLVAMATVSAWDKLGSNAEEAKKQGKTTGQYLVDKMNENNGSSDGILGKADTWLKKAYALWDSMSDTGGASNKYDAYGTLKPRGIRNNNPGNLNYARQAGASKEGGENGRFAVFGNMRDGIAALYKQLQLYIGRGVNTIESIVNKYAPASDNNNVGAYVRQLVGATGKDANEKLSGSDTETIFKLMRGIINHENGPDGKKYITDQDIRSGIQVGATATAMRQKSMQPQPSQNNKTEINISEMSVSSSAGSINQLGQDVQSRVNRSALVSAYSTGQR